MTRISTSTDKLRNQLLNELQKEAEQMLKQMAQQFADSLNETAQTSLSDIASGADGGGSSLTSGLPQIFSSALGLIFNRPQVKVSTSQSSRSLVSDQQFRLSQSQAAAQASAQLAKGTKNS